MAVIIDTFEVVNDGGEDKVSADKTETSRSTAASVKPADIEAIFEHQYIRKERIRAH